jgi:hypothetical protein
MKKAPQKERKEAPQKERKEAPQKERKEAPQKERKEAPQKERKEAPQKERKEAPQKERKEAPKPSCDRYKFEVLLIGKDIGKAVDVEDDEEKMEIINTFLNRDYNITNISILSDNSISFTICSAPDKKFNVKDIITINEELKAHSYFLKLQLTIQQYSLKHVKASRRAYSLT